MPNKSLLQTSDNFIIKANGWCYVVKYDDLVYVNVNDHYCNFYFEGVAEPLTIRFSLRQLCLPEEFVKIRKNCIVNTKHIFAYTVAYVSVRLNNAIITLDSNAPTEQFDNFYGPAIN